MLRMLLGLAWWPLRELLCFLARVAMRLRSGRRGVLVVDGSLRALASRAHEVEEAASACRARAVRLRLRGVSWSRAELADWREAVARMRAAGTRVEAWIEDAGDAAALLASASDRVCMPRLGMWAATGPSAHPVFLGEALDRIGARFEIEAVGPWKSAGDMFGRSFASPAGREALADVVLELHRELVSGIARGRGMDPERAGELVDESPLGAEAARAAGLVDEVCPERDMDEALEGLLGGEPRLVPALRVARLARLRRRLRGLLSGHPVVAVLHLSGPIVSSGAVPRRRSISSALVPELLRGLARRPGLRAVVLALESPGGSALASDMIWCEVERLRRVVPVVASLGTVAASGGYYVASAANEIVARPTTVTGSIGVLGGKVVLGPALDRFGVHGERIAAGRNAGWMHPGEGFTEDQRERLRSLLEDIYQVFLRRVAAGRNMPLSAVERVAGGRIWSGRQALECGLVDRLGGLDLALARARTLGGLRPEQPWHRLDLRVRAPRQLLRRLRLESRLPAALELLLERPGEALAVLPVEPWPQGRPRG